MSDINALYDALEQLDAEMCALKNKGALADAGRWLIRHSIVQPVIDGDSTPAQALSLVKMMREKVGRDAGQK